MGYLYDRNLDDGRGEVKKTEIPLDGSEIHVTQFDRSSNTRASWDTDGTSESSQRDIHKTDQKQSKGSKTRHRQGSGGSYNKKYGVWVE